MAIMITNRDTKLLTLTLNHGVMSFEQVRRYCFPNVASPTIHNRLSRLKREGLLQSMRVGTVIYHGRPKLIGVVYQATNGTLKLVRKHLPDEQFMPHLVRINTATLHHDLLLIDVIHALKERFNNCQVANGKVVKASDLDPKRVPDAVILNPIDVSRIAVELELSAKSKGRYREIIMQYRMSSAYTKVLYVVNSRTLREDLQSLMTHKPVPGLPLPSTGKFYFADLGELLSKSTEALISNGSSEPLIKQHLKLNV